MMRSKAFAIVPAVALAAACVAAACAPPVSPRPPHVSGSSVPRPTTTAPTTTTTLPPIYTGPAVLYSAKPLDGWGQDNIAYVVKIVGNTVYVGGDFAHAVRHGVTVSRSNLMAVDLTTGALKTGFVANTDGIVYSLASDGASLFIGGDFTTVNGVPRNSLAKVNLATGAVDATFGASTPGVVNDLLVAGTKLYVVGQFGSVDGVSRKSGAAVNTTTGALDPNFDAGANGRVETVAINRYRTKLYLGGTFTQLGATAQPYLAEVDPTTGRVQGPSFPSIPAHARDVTVKDDGTHVYAAVGGKYNSAVDLDASTGKQLWRVHVDGDTQAVVSSNGYVYMGFHDGYQGNNFLRLLAVDPTSGDVNQSFMPLSSSYPGVLTLDADGRYLVAGGLFASMGGVAVKGLSIHPAG
jgi:hypothetical protein